MVQQDAHGRDGSYAIGSRLQCSADECRGAGNVAVPQGVRIRSVANACPGSENPRDRGADILRGEDCLSARRCGQPSVGLQCGGQDYRHQSLEYGGRLTRQFVPYGFRCLISGDDRNPFGWKLTFFHQLNSFSSTQPCTKKPRSERTHCTNLNRLKSTTPPWERLLKRPLLGSHCETPSS